MLRHLILLLIAVGFATPAGAEWQQASTRHFIIYADADSNDLRNYALKLERFDQAVRIARHMGDPPLTDSGRLTIYTFKSMAALDELTENNWGTYGLYFTRASGAYAYVARNKANGPGDFTSELNFFHEYAHHLMFQESSAYYPPWLAEGFAELLSTAVVADDGKVTFGAAADHRSAGVFAPDHDLPVSAMVGDTDRSFTGWQRELLYSRGWLLTHYLTFEPSRKGQLDRYVEGIRSGMTPMESAKAAFGDLLKLDRDLDAYARRRTLSGTVVATDPSKIGRIDIRPLSEAEEAMLPVDMELNVGADRVTAARIDGRARRVASRFPTDPFAQATLAEAEQNARNYPEAIAAADHALAADPSNVKAMIFKGRALMRQSKASGAPSSTLDAARDLFVRANHIDPENPEPLMLFYQTFTQSVAPPTPSAVKGLLYALVLAPQDDGLRLIAVRQLIADGRIAEAKREFAPLASNPHVRDFRDTAQAIRSALEASDTAGALSLIDAWQAKQESKDS